jgi:hypothetical protein
MFMKLRKTLLPQWRRALLMRCFHLKTFMVRRWFGLEACSETINLPDL